ncbi:hypothetical protein IAG41_19710 [Sphingomonas sp. JC676]|uniref:hypothetical protein n=1 Tax=Sphingomonas sp. JC676 TaxID=2768065 RepID=UPI001657EC6E|nr:hypothetical protein [Sphingomonas sp. JC676]MBC9034622.1 hypothetical protein [Sphingomonas sp. JC676]
MTVPLLIGVGAFIVAMCFYEHRLKQVLRALHDRNGTSLSLLQRIGLGCAHMNGYVWSGRHRKLGDPVVTKAVLNARLAIWPVTLAWLAVAMCLVLAPRL